MGDFNTFVWPLNMDGRVNEMKKIFLLSLLFLTLGIVIKECIPYTYLGYEEKVIQKNEN
jgi:hypothetical protein